MKKEEILEFWANCQPSNATRKRHTINLIRYFFPARQVSMADFHKELSPLPICIGGEPCKNCGVNDWKTKSAGRCLNCKYGSLTDAVIQDALVVVHEGKTPISRPDAKKEGRKLYYSVQPCSNGHDSPRYVSNKTCVECIAATETTTRYYDPKPQRTLDKVLNAPREQLQSLHDDFAKYDINHMTSNGFLYYVEIMHVLKERLNLQMPKNKVDVELSSDTIEEDRRINATIEAIKNKEQIG